jgi:hypothetical protein
MVDYSTHGGAWLPHLHDNRLHFFELSQDSLRDPVRQRFQEVVFPSKDKLMNAGIDLLIVHGIPKVITPCTFGKIAVKLHINLKLSANVLFIGENAVIGIEYSVVKTDDVELSFSCLRHCHSLLFALRQHARRSTSTLPLLNFRPGVT